jgi:chromosome segregation ATPase
MNQSLGVIIESLVAILLVLTIGYCMLLNARLKRLKADEQSMRAVIAELVTATEIAERAIGGLKHTVRDVNENLGEQLASAAQMSEHLKRQLAEGDHVVRRLSKIALAARPPSAEAEPPKAAAMDSARELVRDSLNGRTKEPANPRLSGAKAVAAAAQAFTERRRGGGLAA